MPDPEMILEVDLYSADEMIDTFSQAARVEESPTQPISGAFNDATAYTELAVHAINHVDVLLGLIGFWLGRGKIVRIKIGKNTITTKNLADQSIVKVISEVRALSRGK